MAFRGPVVAQWGLEVPASAEAVVDLFLGHVREIDLQKKTRFLTWRFSSDSGKIKNLNSERFTILDLGNGFFYSDFRLESISGLFEGF